MTRKKRDKAKNEKSQAIREFNTPPIQHVTDLHTPPTQSVNLNQDSGQLVNQTDYSAAMQHVRLANNLLYSSPPYSAQASHWGNTMHGVIQPQVQMSTQNTDQGQRQITTQRCHNLNENNVSHVPNTGQYEINQQEKNYYDLNNSILPPPPPQLLHDNGASEEFPTWVNILKGIETRLETRLVNIETKLNNQNKSWQVLEQTLQNQNRRISCLEEQVSNMNSNTRTVPVIVDRVDKIDNVLQKQTKKLTECETSVQTLSDFYDGLQSSKEEEFEELQHQIDMLKLQNEKLKKNQVEQKEVLLDLQCRSMEYNLIFYGIEEEETAYNQRNQETNNITPVDTEEKLKKFLKEEMCLERPIKFQKVHRLGRRSLNQENPRPVIAKFLDLKDRDYVRFNTAEKLKGTTYGIREQFPKDIEMKRKSLYPEMKRAKDDGRKVKLVRDRLYIDNQLFVKETDCLDSPKRNNPGNEKKKVAYNTVFYSKQRSRFPETQANETPLRNRFSALESSTSENVNGKRQARSPVDDQVQTKKPKESVIVSLSESDSSDSEQVNTEMEEKDHTELNTTQ